MLAALLLGTGAAPARAQQGGQAPAGQAAPSGDMSSGAGGVRPNSPAQGGVGSAPGASAEPHPAAPEDRRPAGTSPGEGARPER